jgi:hypothetical protein
MEKSSSCKKFISSSQSSIFVKISQILSNKSSNLSSNIQILSKSLSVLSRIIFLKSGLNFFLKIKSFTTTVHISLLQYLCSAKQSPLLYLQKSHSQNTSNLVLGKVVTIFSTSLKVISRDKIILFIL